MLQKWRHWSVFLRGSNWWNLCSIDCSVGDVWWCYSLYNFWCVGSLWCVFDHVPARSARSQITGYGWRGKEILFRLTLISCAHSFSTHLGILMMASGLRLIPSWSSIHRSGISTNLTSLTLDKLILLTYYVWQTFWRDINLALRFFKSWQINPVSFSFNLTQQTSAVNKILISNRKQ